MAIPIYRPSSEVSQTTTEFTNQTTVSISHSYSYKPRVLITDTAGNMIMGDIVFSSSSISITFVSAISGFVYLS